MKELSIEEKAKAYDEAIERARKIKNGESINVPDGTLIPDAIFPELAESKDERIELLNYLYDVHNDDEERARWIAWLEKQGEQKPVEWSEEDRKMMRNIIDDIHCGTNFNPKVMHAANEREKWFKSICMRYQSKWKPSEAQIKSLQESIGIVGELTPRGELLKELAEQLEKLRED